MERFRLDEEPEVVGTHRNYRNGTQLSNVATTTMSHRTSAMSDVVTPNFRQLQRQGEIIINPCSMTVNQRTTSGSGSVTQVQIASPHTVWVATGDGTITGYYHKYGGGLPSYTECPLPDLDRLTMEAKSRCIANVDSTPYSFAEDLFEIRETLRFLRDPLRTTVRLSRRYAKLRDQMYLRRFRSAKYTSAKLAKDLASLWLEIRFAVMPTFRTILSVMEAWESPRPYRPERRTARSFVRIPRSSDSRLVTKVATGRTFTYQCSAYSEASVRAGILYEVTNPSSGWQYKYGLRFKDIPETFWAVMPMSFMVDRFVNISDFIRGATNLLDPNVKVLGAWTTAKRERQQSIGVRSILESGYTSTIVPDDIIDREFHYDRSVWEIQPQDIIPPFKPLGLVDSATKITDLLALVIQNFRS